MTRKVIIDTNGMMVPGQFGLDIFSELERLGFDSYIVLLPSVKELEKIYAEGKGRDRKAAKIALSLLGRCTVVEKNGFADDVIVEQAITEKAAVLTNDIELKKRLCSKGISTVYLREKTRLSIQ